MSAGTHVHEIDGAHAHTQIEQGATLMILDNDLVNVLHAERRLEAAQERMTRKLVTASHDRAPTFSASRIAATRLHARMMRGLLVLGTR